MPRWFLFLCLLLCGGSTTCAQDTLPPTNTVEIRPFDTQRITSYRADPSLQYDRDLHQQQSWWEQLKAWLKELFSHWFNEGVGAFFSTNLVYVLSAVVVIIALLVLSRGSMRRVFHGAPRSLGEVTAAEEDIRGLDIETLIREAEEGNDLRRAIRLHYLLVLRKLVDDGVLKWSPERTDQDYLAQIKDPALRSRFAHIALVFQWVWYGHAEVDAERYGSIKRPFLEFERAQAP
ncbi:MAG: DUF4129 domain-containing protein [Flavobacteriales bacterium]|nr:DUF4129 domain-containing protein [Flavobacteriales bacterium]